MMPAVLSLTPIQGELSPLPVNSPARTTPSSIGFGTLLEKGLGEVEARVARADNLVMAYARGETIPVHQVTLALEQARVAVELAVQVRTRLVETYRDFMSMQL